MKFLILSCNTGEGHNSAAKAVKEYIELRGDECDIKDALAYWSERNSKIISKGHVFLYRRLPKLFGVGYRFEENHPAKEDDNSLMYSLCIKGSEALYDDIIENKYDAIICTHVFAAMMLTELRRTKGFKPKTYLIGTDYTCHPGTSELSVDKYFIAHNDVIDDYLKNGIDKNSLVVSGIPIRQAFYKKVDSAEAKKTLKLPATSKIILMTCGSMGCGPIEALATKLPDMLPQNSHLVIICGHNRKLYKKLTKNGIPSNLSVVGFTSRMALYMDAADLILTKPGGLSTSEAAYKHLPMLLINAVPGCETHNLNFFVSKKFAIAETQTAKLLSCVCSLMEHPEKLEETSKLMEKEFTGCACEIIYETICNDISSKVQEPAVAKA